MTRLAPLALLAVLALPPPAVAQRPYGPVEGRLPGPVPARSPEAAQLLQADLPAGSILVLASWKCSFMRLARVNELVEAIVAEPLDRLVQRRRLAGWGILNQGFRDEWNYHTYYVARDRTAYEDALAAVLTYANRERREELAEFYDLCSETRESLYHVIASRP